MTDRADRMRFIDQQVRVVLLLELDDFGQRCFITIHTEYRVYRDQNACVAAILGLTQAPLEIFDIIVTESAKLAAGHAGAIDDALMRVLVEDRNIAGSKERCD